MGFTNSVSGGITASGDGSIAMGYAVNTITASADGAVAIGFDVGATAANAFAFGESFTNSDADSFKIGFDSASEFNVDTDSTDVTGFFTALGGVHVGGTSDPVDDVLVVDNYGRFIGGLHVGGTTDPGTNNLLVDGYGQVAGELRQGTTDYGAWDIQTSDDLYVNDYGVFMGGLHVGGTSDSTTDDLVVDGWVNVADYVGASGGIHVGATTDPGTDNLWVDGDLLVRTTSQTVIGVSWNVVFDSVSSQIYSTAIVITSKTDSKIILGLQFEKDTSLTSSDQWISFVAGSSEVGKIHSEVTYGTFTGAHSGQSDDNPDTWIQGMAICSSGETIHEPSMGRALIKIHICDEAYDRKVIGVYDQADYNHNSKGFDVNKPEIWYNALGEGLILVSDHGEDIEVGDYITTSPVTGYNMKQEDDVVHSYTVAKATVSIHWDDEPEDPILGFKTKLLACTYHGG